ncbi:MAG TPA: arsenic transporter [Bacillales bacterium]
MIEIQIIFTLTIFFITVLFIVWRPLGINEAVPSVLGAALIFIAGIVPLIDIYEIMGIVSGASITILSTIVMSIVLESIGFFRWAALNLLMKANGSGVKLFWYINILCFSMTMFINNDGSVLITTPIIIQIVNILNLKPHQKLPYLFAGVLIATASSAPIGVSNLANLIALNIVGLDLNSYVKIVFVPSMIGLVTISLLLFLYFKKDIPRRIHTYSNDPVTFNLLKAPNDRFGVKHHPLYQPSGSRKPVDWKMFRICIIIVIAVRVSYFTFTPLGVPIELMAIIGAILLIAIRMFREKKGVGDVLKKTPWHIFIFAFSMYVIVYALKNTGFLSFLVGIVQEPISGNLLYASLIMGLLTTVMSNFFNNLPAVMIGTLMLVDMDLKSQFLQVAYLANVIGSDIGSLLTPMGTLATLIWMFILRKSGIPITWGKYIRVVFMVVPIGLMLSLLSLYLWANWIIF